MTDVKHKELKAYEVDYWIHALKGSGIFDCRKVDEKTEALIIRLFRTLERIRSHGDDNIRRFWITAPRGPFEDYLEECADSDCTEEEAKKWFYIDYPDETKWYDLRSMTRDDYCGVFLAKEYVLAVNDRNSSGYAIDASEFVEWLIWKTEETVHALEDGKYNDRVREELPFKNRYGSISRRHYWDVYPEERKAFKDNFTDEEIEKFLYYVEQQSNVKNGKCRYEDAYINMTARDYYDACAIGYKSAGCEDRRRWRFEDSEEEHNRYGGTTPKEMYYSYADGRDDGLCNVPIDDEAEFDRWFHKKGDYYEHNGSHPYEIRPSGSIRYSIHLIPRKYEESENRWYLALSGDAYVTSIETIKMFIGMKDAGIPVVLGDAEGIAARLTETDTIGILPETVPSFAARYGHPLYDEDVVDFINLPHEPDKAKIIIEHAEWMPEPVIELEAIV